MRLARDPAIALIGVAVLALAATFARPTLNLETETYRYVFVFDISQSMNVKDIEGFESEITRLDFAKQAAVQSIARLPCGSEIGLALFTGHRAFLMVTPIEICANYRELSAMIDNVSWRMTWKPRSEIAKGIFKSVALLTQLDATSRLVFFSDGHESPPINPEIPPTFVGEPGAIKGLVVGVGGATPVPIPKFDKFGEQQGYWAADEVTHTDSFTQQQAAREGIDSQSSGTEHLSSLKEDYLKSLARSTGLTYVRLIGAEDLEQWLTTESLGLPTRADIDIRWALALLALILFSLSLVAGRISAESAETISTG